jgi:hypothetical protein
MGSIDPETGTVVPIVMFFMFFKLLTCLFSGGGGDERSRLALLLFVFFCSGFLWFFNRLSRACPAGMVFE